MTSANDERVNILLVDDQPNNLLALESILAEMGQNLVRADSGRAALRALLDQASVEEHQHCEREARQAHSNT